MSDARPDDVPEDEKAVDAADELLAGEGERGAVAQEVAPGEADRLAPGAVADGVEHLR